MKGKLMLYVLEIFINYMHILYANLQTQGKIYNLLFVRPSFNGLTLKAPNKNCSRRHINFLLLSSKKIRLDSLETLSLIFSEKQ